MKKMEKEKYNRVLENKKELSGIESELNRLKEKLINLEKSTENRNSKKGK